MSDFDHDDAPEAVAIIGMAGRFPGAADLGEFWRLLDAGEEGVRPLSDSDLLAAGADPTAISRPEFVKMGAAVAGADLFDADFFGFSPREAEVLDPQHRVFLEVAWEALEGAGYAVPGFDGWVGVFGGTGMSSYLWNNVATRPEILSSVGDFQALIANDRDYFTTRISYKLNLRGPSVNVQTACSTGLVAVHLACQSLLSYQTTLAVAGASRLYFPQNGGYLYQEGGIQSSDGRCRAFDAKASGAIFGDGVGAVVLKRLSDALADGDRIRAVILGSAMNNDGSFKVGYTAPSVEGQAEVIALAQAVAGVTPEEIGYVEAHGSGTPLGDPIEVAALTQAFRAGTDKRAFCALGSVKTNVGHLDNAAGIAGLIKTVLALEHGSIPPSLHFDEPNPRVDWEGSPFYVAGSRRPWPAAAGGAPRKAGVSSFGMGGTNVHAIVAEAPPPEPPAPAPGAALLVLSARSATALEAATDRLAAHLKGTSSTATPALQKDDPDHVPLSHLGRGDRGEGSGAAEESLADVAFTLSAGRTPFDHRRVLVARDGESLLEVGEALVARDPRRLVSAVRAEGEKRPVFLLSGLGEHHLGMGAGLYLEEPVFRDAIDQAAEILRPILGADLRELLYPGGAEAWARPAGSGGGKPDLKRLLARTPAPASPEEARLHETAFAQPAVYAVGYALGALWQSWGVAPAALAGYSLGEYTAAALAGVFSFEDGLRLVAERARAIAALPPGAMLAVPLAEAEIAPRLGEGLAVAALNGPAQSVVAGSPEAVAALEESLAAVGIAARQLPTTHAFHSPALAPAAGPLRALLAKIPLAPPRLPLFSNVTGAEMTAAEATSPDFWVRHLLEPVRFGDLLSALGGEPGRVFLEVGPGGALAAVALQHPWEEAPPPVLRSLPLAHEPRPAREAVLESLGQLWALGVPVDWSGFWAGQKRRRVPLPTYPFERRRYFVEPRRSRGPRSVAAEAAPETAAPAIPAAPDIGGEPAAPTALALADSNRPNVKTAYAEPRSDSERQVAAIWQEVLGVHPVGAFDNFFELGGNSLIAPRLVFALRESFGVDFPVAGLFEVPTVAQLTEAVEFIAREGLAAAIASVERFDLKSEVVLEDAIDAHGLPPVAWEEPETIALTGATGFLGAYLLRDLLEHTGARLVLPTRGRDAGEALARVRENLSGRSIWKEEYAERLEALPAELGEPRWGLSEADFDRLAREAGAIYHCGAWVNFTYPYRGLKAVNVGGTVEALRLASTHQIKPLHFISTVAVFSPLTFVGGRKAYEDDPLPHTLGLFGGYGESKWVAEQLVRLAHERGIPTAVYRPGILAGDTVTGSSNPRDMIWNVIKGSIQLGITHDDPAYIDVTPVDYVSRAIVHLATRPESMGHAFHFPNPRPMLWRQMVEELRDYGYPLEMIADADWLKLVAREVPHQPDNALAPFLPVLVPPEGLEPADRMGELAKAAAAAGLGELSALQAMGDRLVAEQFYDETNTQAGLAGSGITCPPLDTRLLFHYLDYFVRVGWLPAPPGGPGAQAGRREMRIEA